MNKGEKANLADLQYCLELTLFRYRRDDQRLEDSAVQKKSFEERCRGEEFLKKVSREMFTLEREREIFLWNRELRFFLSFFLFFPLSLQEGRFTMVNVHLRSRQYAFPLAHRHLSPPSFPIQSECSRLVSRIGNRVSYSSPRFLDNETNRRILTRIIFSKNLSFKATNEVKKRNLEQTPL